MKKHINYLISMLKAWRTMDIILSGTFGEFVAVK